VRYAELQLTTTFRPFDCLAEAAEEADRQSDITVRFIADAPRALPSRSVAHARSREDDAPCRCLGLGGRDAFPRAVRRVFAEARRGLRSVPHAGEDAGPESVRGAIDVLHADRIMHGVRSVEDPALLAELAQRRIRWMSAPTSNRLLGVTPSLDDHPLRALWDAGVVVTINTDDPGLFGCTILDEYRIAGRILDADREPYTSPATPSTPLRPRSSQARLSSPSKAGSTRAWPRAASAIGAGDPRQ
jgi:aminodeoxyfutalosine deaminase